MAHPNTQMSSDLKQSMWRGLCALTVEAECSFLLVWFTVSHPVLWRPWNLMPCLLGGEGRTLVNACWIKGERQRASSCQSKKLQQVVVVAAVVVAVFPKLKIVWFLL